MRFFVALNDTSIMVAGDFTVQNSMCTSSATAVAWPDTDTIYWYLFMLLLSWEMSFRLYPTRTLVILCKKMYNYCQWTFLMPSNLSLRKGKNVTSFNFNCEIQSIMRNTLVLPKVVNLWVQWFHIVHITHYFLQWLGFPQNVHMNAITCIHCITL